MTGILSSSMVARAWRGSRLRGVLVGSWARLAQAARASRLNPAKDASPGLTASSTVLGSLDHRLFSPASRGVGSARVLQPSTPGAAFAGALLLTLAAVVGGLALVGRIPGVGLLVAACLAVAGLASLSIEDLGKVAEESWLLSGRLPFTTGGRTDDD